MTPPAVSMTDTPAPTAELLDQRLRDILRPSAL